jgi:uncharacterized protein (DUF1501 family)
MNNNEPMNETNVSVEESLMDDVRTDDTYLYDLPVDDANADDMCTDDMYPENLSRDDMYADNTSLDNMHADNMHADNMHADDMYISDAVSRVGCAEKQAVDAALIEVSGHAHRISRRGVLGGILGGAAAVVGGSLADPLAAATRRVKPKGKAFQETPAAATPAAPIPTPSAEGAGILVLLTLYGGNDGLNTLIPTDSAYLAARGALAYQPTETLSIDPGFGLNPVMTGFKGLWDQKRLAIVRGVGYPNPNRSHFRAMDIWQSAVPEKAELSGWLGRWHDATGGDALRMVNIGPSMPRAMVSVKGGGGAALPNGNVAIGGGGNFTKAFAELASATDDFGPLGSRIVANASDLGRVVAKLGPIVKTTKGVGAVNLEGGATADGLEKTVLDTQFDEVARLIKGGAPTRVYGVALGGFDTHAVEREAHRSLLGAVDRAVTRFVNDMAASPAGGKVTVLIYSEFGRRVAANLSDGTDHGAAAPVFVVGPSVKGGFYGDPPSLTDLDDGDLKFTVDFRRVYATVMGSTLGLDPVAVLGKAYEGMGFL